MIVPSQTKEGKKGGFSAFIRRLTKRKPAKLGAKDVNVQVVQAVRAENMSKIASAPIRRPLSPVPDSRSSEGIFQSAPAAPASAPAPAPDQMLSPAQSIASAHRLASTPSNSSQLGVPLRDVDPVNVPLPPSPNVDDASGSGSGSGFASIMVPTPPTVSTPTVTAQPAISPRHLASPQLSLPRSRSASPRAGPREIPGATPRLPSSTGVAGYDDESVETIDEVRPLESLRIITRARSMSPGQVGPLSASASSVAETLLHTPSTLAASPPLPVSTLASAMENSSLNAAESDAEAARGNKMGEKRLSVSDEEREEMRDEMEEIDYLDTPMYAGSSPPRKAPIGSGNVGAPVSLGRKESKWRKSVMGLSDVSYLAVVCRST